jgi:hypothetical protein
MIISEYDDRRKMSWKAPYNSKMRLLRIMPHPLLWVRGAGTILMAGSSTALAVQSVDIWIVSDSIAIRSPNLSEARDFLAGEGNDAFVYTPFDKILVFLCIRLSVHIVSL